MLTCAAVLRVAVQQGGDVTHTLGHVAHRCDSGLMRTVLRGQLGPCDRNLVRRRDARDAVPLQPVHAVRPCELPLARRGAQRVARGHGVVAGRDRLRVEALLQLCAPLLQPSSLFGPCRALSGGECRHIYLSTA